MRCKSKFLVVVVKSIRMSFHQACRESNKNSRDAHHTAKLIKNRMSHILSELNWNDKKRTIRKWKFLLDNRHNMKALQKLIVHGAVARHKLSQIIIEFNFLFRFTSTFIALRLIRQSIMIAITAECTLGLSWRISREGKKQQHELTNT